MNPECLALFKKMSEYIDGELDTELVAFAEKHLANCMECGENLAFMKKTLEIIRNSQPEQIPETIRQALREVIFSEQKGKVS